MSLAEWEATYHPANNDPIPELRAPQESAEAGERRSRVTPDRVRQAIAIATGIDPDDMPEGEGEEDTRYVVPRPQSAVSFAQERDMPMHDPQRRSQQPAGRHARYVRAQAAKWGVTEAVADARIKSHPADCEWRS